MSLSLYIHIPFCVSKCVYCDFTSGYRPEEKMVADYVVALKRELELFSAQYPEKTSLTTLYIGGGTPSLLDSRFLGELFEAVGKDYSGDRIETTLEANPDDVTGEKARDWKAMGVDRVSLGIQSMEDSVLELLGRRNTPAQNRASFAALRSAGFVNISADWIAGVRGENNEKNIREMLSLLPEHFSVYQLTLEDKTLLGQRVKKGLYTPLDDEESVQSYWEIDGALASRGYERYEISNYARAPEFASRHNLNYWNRGEYIGIGLGASGFIRGTSGGFRWTNQTSFRDYFGALERMELPVGYSESLDERTAMREFLMLGLRKTEGVRSRDFSRYFGKELATVLDTERVREMKDFLILGSEGMRLTNAGVNIANSVIRKIWDAMK